MKELPRDKDKILEIFRLYDFRMEAGNVKLENCDEFLKLVDAYCDKKTKKQGDCSVVRHGTPEKPPKKSHFCPDCGEFVLGYNLYGQRDVDPFDDDFCGLSPNVPSFYCSKCGCEWQWVPSKSRDDDEVAKDPEQEKEPSPEDNNQEQQNKNMTEITILVGVKKPWYQRFIDYFTLK